MGETPPLEVHCSFYLRTMAPTGWDYTPITQHGYRSGPLITAHPPVVGDLISLQSCPPAPTCGVYAVISRAWRHSSYGSSSWPAGQRHCNVGPYLDLVVEHAIGPFCDCAEVNEDDE